MPKASENALLSQILGMISPYRPGSVFAAHGTLCPLQRTLCLSSNQPACAERFRKRDAVLGFVSRRLKKVQLFFDSNLAGYRASSRQPTASGAAGYLHGSASAWLIALHSNLACLACAPFVGTARQLNPAAKPFKTGRLQVTQLHSLYYEVYGNPAGQPAVVFHGGPGAGCYANHA